LFETHGRVTRIPVHGIDQAVDVTGAGETLLAAYTLALACGASPLEAAHIANIAGGLVVMKRGTATVSRAELLDAIRRDAGGRIQNRHTRPPTRTTCGASAAWPENCASERLLRHSARWPHSLSRIRTPRRRYPRRCREFRLQCLRL